MVDSRPGRASGIYPLQLLRAILDGMKDTQDAQECAAALAEEDWDTQLTLSMNQIAVDKNSPKVCPASSIPKVGGGTVTIKYEATNFRERYLDEYTREVLPLDLVKAAIVEELNYFNERVWEVADEAEASRAPGYKLVRSRWVICNKGGHVRV